MPIGVELRTTCEKCKDPLPINAWDTAVACWSCLHPNRVSPEEWAQLLRSALDDAWALEPGDGVTESRKIGRRNFELRWTHEERANGPTRKRPRAMRKDLFPSVVGLAGEEPRVAAVSGTVAFRCSQCAGSLTIDGRSREVTCEFCGADSLIGDDLWRRLHPIHAQKRWFLLLEDDSDAADPAEAAAPDERTLQFAVGHAGDLTVGPDGLMYAAGTAEDMSTAALWCMDHELRVRWRADVKRSDHAIRVAVVGDEVWYADGGKKSIRRFSRADGKDLGKLDVDAKGIHELTGCPGPTALALVRGRLIRLDPTGRRVHVWPPKTGLWSWFSAGEELDPIPEAASWETDLGQPRPLHAVGVTTRFTIGADGDLWFLTGESLYRYGPDGTRRWTAALPGASATATMRPGLDGDRNAYVIATDTEGKFRLWRVSPKGEVTELRKGGFGHPAGLAVTPDARLFVFGFDAGNVRILDRNGQPLRASAAAVDADRWNEDDEEDPDED